MANEAVLGWDQRVLAVVESAFGSTPAPAGTQALEVISLDMGAAEKPNTRPKRDKTQGRDETNEFVAGRVDPIGFSVETSVKSRATATTVPKESPLYKAGGLVETVGGANVTYSLSSAPAETGLSILRVVGTTPAAYLAEQGYGGVIKSLEWTGGDAELMLKASGAFAGKNQLGYVASATVADGSSTTFTTSAGDAYLIDPGYYMIEAEVVLVTAVNRTNGNLTVTRAQLGTTGAAHAAKPIYPHIPTLTLAGSPISEANVSVTLDSVALRAMKFSIRLDTGIDHRPLESGSARVQGTRAGRVKVASSIDMVLNREGVDLLNKAKQRKSVACTIVAGAGAGSIVTFSMPTCEVGAFATPDAAELVQVTVPLMVRGNAGNDSLSVVLT